MGVLFYGVKLSRKTRGGFCCAQTRLRMPTKPKRPCGYPGCPELTSGYCCEKHHKEMNKRYDRYERDPETRKRYGHEWRKIRERYITKHPLCEECKKNGRLQPTEEVHHILPLSKGGTHDDSNLMSLCKSCHSRLSALEGNRWHINDRG